MPVQPSPWPWAIKDYEERAYQIVAANGVVVALMHYPQNTEQAANCKLIEKAAVLLEKFKHQLTMMEALLRQAGRPPESDPYVKSARELLAELEIRDPLKKGPPV